MLNQGSGRAVVGVCLGLTLIGLAACDESESEQFQDRSEAKTLVAMAPAAMSRQVAVAGDVTSAAQQKRMAVSHTYTLRLPSGEVERVQQQHLDACVKLGCSVLSTRLDRANEGRINAWSSIRIAPDAQAAFTKAITAPPVEVISHAESAEDKTLPLLDIEKRLEAKLALRERLDALLRDKTRKTAADLIAIEKEIANVQGEIEAATAQRDYLLTITDTVKIDLYYTGVTAQAGGLDLSPIQRAVSGLGRTIVGSVAAMIAFAGAALPWIPIAALVGWGLRAVYRRWRATRLVRAGT